MVEQQSAGGEQTPEVTPPRIYVASLSDYNAGRLHGAWIEPAREADEVHDSITRMLTASQEPGAEEWAIHDYEGFGALRLSEYESIETVAAVARGIVEHGEAFAAWAWLEPALDVEHLDQFEDTYRGVWPSLTDYAESLLDDCGATEAMAAIPTWLQGYIQLNVEAYARDLALSGVLRTVEGAEGVHVFEGGQ